MSEDFVDVTWRGLEVVRKARLRASGAHRAYVEYASPMPTGSQLTIRTSDGHELAAVVARVQEQIGGRTDVPGMEVTIAASGAAATWWLARAEAVANRVEPVANRVEPVANRVEPVANRVEPVANRVEPVGPGLDEATQVQVNVAELARASTEAAAQAAHVRAASRATQTMATVSMPDLRPPAMTPDELAPELAAESPAVDPRIAAATTAPMPIVAPATPSIAPVQPVDTGPTRPSARATAVTITPPVGDPRHTQPMFAVGAGAHHDEADAGDGIPTGIDESIDRPEDDAIVDDGRRTMAMTAVDISAIIEAGTRADADDSPGGADPSNGGDKKKAKGKRRHKPR